jgi:hypothetical protein
MTSSTSEEKWWCDVSGAMWLDPAAGTRTAEPAPGGWYQMLKGSSGGGGSLQRTALYLISLQTGKNTENLAN